MSCATASSFSESQTGIDIAGQRINAIETEYAKITPTTVVVRVGNQSMVQVSVRTLFDAVKASTTVTRKTIDVFVEQLEMRLQFEQVVTKLDPDQAAIAARRVLMKSEMFDPREFRKALLRRLELILKEEKMAEAESPEEVARLLNMILATHPELLDEARERALHSCSVLEQAESLPTEIQNESYLPTSRYNIYGVHPPDLNGWERPFAELLDSDTTGIVEWWHRNPPRKPYSVSVLLPRGSGFYPDFIIGVHGRETDQHALLADPKQAFDTYAEAPKSDAVHPAYGKVLILHKDGQQRWMTVRYKQGDSTPILDSPFSITTLASWPAPIQG